MKKTWTEIQVLGTTTLTLHSLLTTEGEENRAKRTTDPVNNLGLSRHPVNGNRNRLKTVRASIPRLFR